MVHRFKGNQPRLLDESPQHDHVSSFVGFQLLAKIIDRDLEISRSPRMGLDSIMLELRRGSLLIEPDSGNERERGYSSVRQTQVPRRPEKQSLLWTGPPYSSPFLPLLPPIRRQTGDVLPFIHSSGSKEVTHHNHPLSAESRKNSLNEHPS